MCDTSFFDHGFRIVEFGCNRFVTQFFSHNHGGVLVEYLIDGDHLAHLHQTLDYLSSLH